MRWFYEMLSSAAITGTKASGNGIRKNIVPNPSVAFSIFEIGLYCRPRYGGVLTV